MPAAEVRLLQNVCPASELGQEWERLVSSNSASGFMQSLHWAQAKSRQGLPSFHIGLFKEEALFGGVIFYTSAKRNGAGLLVAPEGPVLPWQDEELAGELLALIIDTAQAHASELGVMAIRIEPRLAPPPISILREFGRAPVDLVPRETLYIDLSLPEVELLAGMKQKGRYNIKLAERYGVNIYEDKSDEAVSRFYSIMREASERDDFALEPLSFFEHLAAVLLPAGCARFFFSEQGGDNLGTLLLVTYGRRATYLYGGITNQKRNLMSGYALQWAAMKAAKAAGCIMYDFYGFDPFRSPEHQYARFSQFKSQFGGQAVRFIGAHDYFFLDNLADAFIKVIKEAEDHDLLSEQQSSQTIQTVLIVDEESSLKGVQLKTC